MFRGVPEAPRVYPKYYTQTVAITSKPEIPHSTFLIPAARLLSWAPHEEPLLEREVMYLSVCLFLSLSLSLCQSSCFQSSLSHPLPVYLYLSYFPSPVLGFVAHSPTHFFPLAFVCIFLSVPQPASRLPLMLLVCTSPPLYKALTLPPFLLSLFLSPRESPDIHVEIFSHVRYRFTTPARSLWPLNLIPSTKPHCFLVCVWACLLCVTVGKYVWGCVFMHYKVEVGDF